jgi:flagellin-like protein
MLRTHGNPRRRGQRGVSPILAMILVVAIVVVLAAVLYVVVAGIGTHPVGGIPLGTAFLAGPAAQQTGTKATNSYCATGHFCYSVPVDEAGAGLAIGDLSFRVLTATSEPRIVSENHAQVSLVATTGAVLASTEVSKNQPFVVTGWSTLSKGTTDGTTLSSLITIWVQFGNTKTSPFDQGLSLEVVGSNGYAGVVTISLP